MQELKQTTIKPLKVVLWPFTQQKLAILCIFDHFRSFFDIKLTSIDVNISAISINIHLTHQQTAVIDINHHKNYYKVVLWQFTQQKLTILRIFDHF